MKPTPAALIAVLLLAATPLSATAQQNAGTRTPPPPPPPATQPEPEGLFPEPAGLTKAIDVAGKRMGEGGGTSEGFYVETGNMITGAGWISLGPGYKQTVFGGRALLDASAGLSWRLYKMARVRLESTSLADGRLVVGSEVRWQDNTQVSYFGEGPDAPESDRSQYRLRSTSLTGYATVSPRAWLAIDGRLSHVFAPRLGGPTGAFIRDVPSTRELFPGDPVFLRDDQPAYLHGEASIAADTRDRRGHATRGGFYRFGVSAFSDRDGGTFSFRQVQAEAVHFVPLAGGRLVLAGHGWVVGSSTGDDDVIPFYLLPSLGGNNTLRGYHDYRFHDRHAALAQVEARVPIFTHLDAAVFVDAGNVAARFSDLDLGKRSYGAGIRLHSRGSTFARLDIARSAESWQVVFRLNDPLRVSRVSRRTPPVPFAP